MKLNRKGFELVCCNCGSTEIQTWFDEEKKQIVIMCEECENSSREDSEALRQLKELAKRTELELKKEELVETSTEELVTVITQREINSQREQLWYYNTLVASLSQALHDEEGKSVFLSMEELKEELAPEQIDQLLEIWLEFLNTRGNAQVFPEPCTFKG